jgi:hypothetical protein
MTYPHDLMHSDIRDVGVPCLVDGEPMRHVEHVGAPRRFQGTTVGIKRRDGVLRDRGALDQLELAVEASEEK